MNSTQELYRLLMQSGDNFSHSKNISNNHESDPKLSGGESNVADALENVKAPDPLDSNTELQSTDPDFDKAFPCPQCGTVFARNCRLKLHMRIHTGEKPYKCKECGAAFNQSGSLKRHYRIHTGEKPYVCQYCDARFAEKGNLNDHIRHHTGETPYKCRECGAAFALRARLYSHMQTHVVDKPYQCVECGATFRQRGSLYSHCRTHAGKDRFDCDLCHISFKQRANLERHLLTHTGAKTFKCDKCDAEFVEQTQLENHVTQHHTEERPFKCVVCSAGFADKDKWERHCAAHLSDDEKHVKCDKCGKTFTASKQLQDPNGPHKIQNECPVCATSVPESENVERHVQAITVKRPYQCQKCDASFSNEENLVQHSCVQEDEKASRCEKLESATAPDETLQSTLQTSPARCDETRESTDTASNPKKKMCIDSEFLQKWSTTQLGLASCASRWRIPNMPGEEYLNARNHTSLTSTNNVRRLIMNNNFGRSARPIWPPRELNGSGVKDWNARESFRRSTVLSETLKSANSWSHQLTKSSIPKFENECKIESTPADVKKPVITKPTSEVIDTSADSFKVVPKPVVTELVNTAVNPSSYLVHRQRRRRSRPVRGKNRRSKAAQCKECGAKFAHRGRLALHMRIHTGEKPFVCNECGASFSQNGSLRRHATIHKRGPSKPPFPCADCDAGFATSGHLEEHRRIHSDSKQNV